MFGIEALRFAILKSAMATLKFIWAGIHLIFNKICSCWTLFLPLDLFPPIIFSTRCQSERIESISIAYPLGWLTQSGMWSPLMLRIVVGEMLGSASSSLGTWDTVAGDMRRFARVSCSTRETTSGEIFFGAPKSCSSWKMEVVSGDSFRRIVRTSPRFWWRWGAIHLSDIAHEEDSGLLHGAWHRFGPLAADFSTATTINSQNLWLIVLRRLR
jgi:hypothetical protein